MVAEAGINSGHYFPLPQCPLKLPSLLLLIIFTGGSVVLAEVDCDAVENDKLFCVGNITYGDTVDSLMDHCKQLQKVPACMEVIITECHEKLDPQRVHELRNKTQQFQEKFDGLCQTILELQTSGTTPMTSCSSAAYWRPLVLQGFGAFLFCLKAMRYQ